MKVVKHTHALNGSTCSYVGMVTLNWVGLVLTGILVS